MSRLRKLQELSLREWRLLAQAQLLLPLTFGGVYLFGSARWQRVLARLAKFGKIRNSRPDAEKDISKETSEIALMVNIAANHGVSHSQCLQRSLVLWCLLERNGITSQIRYGARKENDQVQAHAWVEIQGVALNDDTHLDFSTLEGSNGINGS